MFDNPHRHRLEVCLANGVTARSVSILGRLGTSQLVLRREDMLHIFDTVALENLKVAFKVVAL